MTFSSLESSVRKQIKASMKRIVQNIIKLNSHSLNKIDSSLSFNLWTSRYIFFDNDKRYYNLTIVDDSLYIGLAEIMETIFQKELQRVRNNDSSADKSSSTGNSYLPATEKQLNYASYLMNMVENKPLPQRSYNQAEINILINHLKKSIKS